MERILELMASGRLTKLYAVSTVYVRLLAETGLVGFWLYMAFLLSIFGRIVHRLKIEDSLSKFIGTAGLFAWIAVIMVNFTQDSFTYPLMWVVFGMILGFDRSLSMKQGKGIGENLE